MPRIPAVLVGRVAALALLLACSQSVAFSAPRQEARPDRARFIQRAGRELRLHGRRFLPVGASNYYLIYKSQAMVDSLLNTAVASGFNTIRTWGFLDIGNQDGSNSIRGKQEGVYFHYWDGSAPAYNDGPDGLQHLDYVVYKAGQLNLRLVIPFVNNWNDFGGMDQYVRWLDGQYHDQFYTDPTIRTWYKDWIAHLLNRTNTYTGVAYKDDPTIMTWELANEPRCRAYGVYGESGTCTTQTLVDWADDVSWFVKSIDTRHLVSVGDEGFFCTPGASDWTENCGEGVDTLALADLPNVDIASFHLYPDNWGKDVAWGTAWISRHIQEARNIQERAVLGEFGLRDKAIRNPAYKAWTDTVLRNRGAGAMYWILSDKQDDGTYYPDYDGFTVYCPSPVCTTFGNFGRMLALGRPLYFPPVADHDSAVVEFDAPAILAATANDITYLGIPLLRDSLDLDPALPGKQRQYSSAAGTFVVQSGGNVSFTPTPGFSGDAVASYVVRDVLRRLSNPATLTVTVKPDPNAAIRLFSFETGIEGWGALHAGSGTVEQSPDFATDGSYSLKVTTTSEDWFGRVLAPTPADLTPKTHLRFDIQTTSAGTSQNAVLQLTDSWTWCQGSWGPWINPNTTTTIDIDLLTLDCGVTDVSKVQALYVWLSGGGAFYVDNVRAE
jgi:mannan endo-1,4-beta-mannosidase